MNEDFQVDGQHVSMGMLFEAMPAAAVLVDREGRHVALNQSLASISGLSKEELLNKKVSDLSEESGQNILRDFQAFDAGLNVPEHELVIDDRVFQASVKPLRNSEGFAFGEIVVLTDISAIKEIERKLKEANAQLLHQATRDWLTNTLNAQTYYRNAEDLFESARRADKPASVLFIDLDHFKAVNDDHGHDAGDQVLAGVAQCIKNVCGQGDIVGRLGGEEFAVFLSNANQQEAFSIAEQLRRDIEHSAPVSSNAKIHVTASIGVASLAEGHKTVTDLVRDADQAMYHSKRSGRNRVSCFGRPDREKPSKKTPGKEGEAQLPSNPSQPNETAREGDRADLGNDRTRSTACTAPSPS